MKTIPKDKSNITFYADSRFNLKCSKPLLHSRKEWLDEGTFHINKEDIVGWVDLEKEIERDNLEKE